MYYERDQEWILKCLGILHILYLSDKTTWSNFTVSSKCPGKENEKAEKFQNYPKRCTGVFEEIKLDVRAPFSTNCNPIRLKIDRICRRCDWRAWKYNNGKKIFLGWALTAPRRPKQILEKSLERKDTLISTQTLLQIRFKKSFLIIVGLENFQSQDG